MEPLNPGWVLLQHAFRHLWLGHCGFPDLDAGVGLAIADIARLKLEIGTAWATAKES
jgi:hypothetical protein